MKKQGGWGALFAALVAAAAIGGCRGAKKEPGREAEGAPTMLEAAMATEGDMRAGLALAKTFECARCHEHDALEPPKLDKAATRRSRRGSFRRTSR
jgi:hypothetical protein